MMSTRDWALDLYDHGYQVLPGATQAKMPTIPWKPYQTERVPRDLVEKHFNADARRTNLMIVTGEFAGVVVLDADTDAAVAAVENNCATTAFAWTTRRGKQYAYRHPGGVWIKTRARVPFFDCAIDVKADGGITRCVGSIHESGHVYALDAGACIVSPADLPILDINWLPVQILGNAATEPVTNRPTWAWGNPIVIGVSNENTNLAQAQRYIAHVPGAVQGSGGDHATFTVCCRLVRDFNLSDDEALSLLSEWNSKCTPPWSLTELMSKVRGARAYGSGWYGSKLRSSVVPFRRRVG